MRSASSDCSTLARRGRSRVSSVPTPWRVLKVTRRTGMGGWSGPGAGLVMGPSSSAGGQGQVEDLLQLRVPGVGGPQQETRLAAGEDQLAELVTEERAGQLLPIQLAGADHLRPLQLAAAAPARPREAGHQGARPPAPADPEADLDRVRRLVVQRR